MRGLYLVLIVTVVLHSCQDKRAPVKTPEEIAIAKKDSVRIANSILGKNARSEFLKLIDEPSFENVNYETYRYVYSCSFAPSFVFTVIADSNNIILSTKCIIDGCRCDDSILIPYGKKVYNITKNDTVVATSMQKLSVREFEHFKKNT